MSLETFESKEVTINSPDYALFASFSDLRNLASRLPEEYREKVRISEDLIEGEYNGMSMGMRVVEKTPYTRIVLQGEGQLPLNFSLVFSFRSISAAQTALKISIEAEMNFMLKAMLGKKIREGLDKLTQSLQQS